MAGVLLADAEELVVARSVASANYLKQRVVDGRPQPQTYVFMPGRYFAGTTRDRTLDGTKFRMIAERLAGDLRRQEFHPAASLAQADLLLVVHWGVTTGSNRDTVSVALGLDNLANIGRETEHAQQQLSEALAAGDPEAIGRAQDNLANLAQDARTEQDLIRGSQYSGNEDNATLLGLDVELRKEDRNPFGSPLRQSILEMAGEERYFVIVMAYDARALVNTRQMHRVWTLRASIRSAGVNFHQALDRMGNIAGRYFGTKQDGLILDHTGDRRRRESVTLGDLIVLGTTPDR